MGCGGKTETIRQGRAVDRKAEGKQRREAKGEGEKEGRN